MKQEKNYKQIKKQQKVNNAKKFKEKYFEYYDDVKSHTHDVYDW